MEEIWKDIEGFEDYCVSNKGRIASRKKGKMVILTPSIDIDGYYQTSIYNKTERKSVRLHSLVAKYFIGKPSEGEVVDHIDRNKLNNDVSNLRYIDRAENTRRGVSKKILVDDMVFNSITEASKYLNCNYHCLYKAVSGIRKTYRGHIITRIQ